jgi:hypothetical protein
VQSFKDRLAYPLGLGFMHVLNDTHQIGREPYGRLVMKEDDQNARILYLWYKIHRDLKA